MKLTDFPYDPIKVSMKRKVNLSELHERENTEGLRMVRDIVVGFIGAAIGIIMIGVIHQVCEFLDKLPN